MSIAAYKRTIRESESPRQIERRILSQVTSRMEGMADAFDRAPGKTERLAILSDGLRTALQENQKFWQTLRHGLAAPGNALPEGLRASLLSLTLWVDRQTTAILGGNGGVRALCQVNHNIAGGLAGEAPRPIG